MEFAWIFLSSVVVLVMCLFLCSDAPVRTQRFVPQTNMSPRESQNDTHILHM